LFLSPFFQHKPDLLPWQASTYRWRGINQATFDPSYLLILIPGCLAGAVLICRRGRRSSDGNLFSLEEPIALAIAGLSIWCIGNALLLATFYLYSPIVATRYILDFAPAFLAPFILVLLLCTPRWPRLIPVLLLTWIISESTVRWLGQRNLYVPAPLSREELSALPEPTGRKLASFSGRYSIENHPDQTKIKYNGQGWEEDSEAASAIVTLMVDRPEFLEISVGRREAKDAISDAYRAKIGNMELPVESIKPGYIGSNQMHKVRFRIPEGIRSQNVDQLVFLCFTTSWQKIDIESRRPLHEVRWR
ncbi:MAG TPA: hypothetical protein VGF13_00310, partial [Verrucomicrobiae bacterium]